MPSKLSNLRTTFKAVAPILFNAINSGQLFNPQCKLTEPDPDILCEYDIKIPISEGFSGFGDRISEAQKIIHQ